MINLIYLLNTLNELKISQILSNKLKIQITLMHENSIVKINYFYKLIIDIKLENINFNDKSVSSFIYIHLQVYKFVNYVTYNWSDHPP